MTQKDEKSYIAFLYKNTTNTVTNIWIIPLIFTREIIRNMAKNTQ